MAATVTGKVFLDTSRTGRYEAGKPGLSGVTVVLAGKTEARPAVTDANGDFSFSVDASAVYTLYIPSSASGGGPVAASDSATPPYRGARAFLVTVTRANICDNAVLPGFDFVLAAREGALPALPPQAQPGTGADVSVQLALQPNPIYCGNWLTCAATVSNAGPELATGVFLTSTTPAALGCVRYSTSNGAAWGAWDGSASLGSLAVGASITVYLVGRVERCPAGGITWEVSVSSQTPDPVLDNNTAAAVATVRSACLPHTSIVPDAFSPQARRRWTGDDSAGCGATGASEAATTAGATAATGTTGTTGTTAGNRRNNQTGRNAGCNGQMNRFSGGRNRFGRG